MRIGLKTLFTGGLENIRLACQLAPPASVTMYVIAVGATVAAAARLGFSVQRTAADLDRERAAT